MLPEMIPTELLDLIDFPSAPYFDDISIVWEGRALPGVLPLRELAAAIDSALSWDVDDFQPFTVWDSSEDRALLLLNSATGHVELRLHDSLRQHEGGQLYVHWLSTLVR